MPTVKQMAAVARGYGDIPETDRTSVAQLLEAVQPSPRRSVRALLGKCETYRSFHDGLKIARDALGDRSRLRMGDTLGKRREEALNHTPHFMSPNGQLWLVFQSDGNLVLSNKGQGPLWSTKTNGKDNARFVTLQTDGNLVLSSEPGGKGEVAWASNTVYNVPCELVLQNDGNAVLVDISKNPHAPLWHTGSYGFIKRQPEEGGIFHDIAGIALDLSSSASDWLGGVPVVGPGLSGLYGWTYGATLNACAKIAQGESVDKALVEGYREKIQSLKEVAPYVETIVAMVPAIGPPVSSAIAAGLALAQGRSWDDIAIEAAIAALPGGPLVKSCARIAVAAGRGEPIDEAVAIDAFSQALGIEMSEEQKSGLRSTLRVARDVAEGTPVENALLNEADNFMNLLPPELRTVGSCGLAIGHGRRLQDLAVQELTGMAGPLIESGKKDVADSYPVVAARREAARRRDAFDLATALVAQRAGPREIKAALKIL